MLICLLDLKFCQFERILLAVSFSDRKRYLHLDCTYAKGLWEYHKQEEPGDVFLAHIFWSRNAQWAKRINVKWVTAAFTRNHWSTDPCPAGSRLPEPRILRCSRFCHKTRHGHQASVGNLNDTKWTYRCLQVKWTCKSLQRVMWVSLKSYKCFCEHEQAKMCEGSGPFASFHLFG